MRQRHQLDRIYCVMYTYLLGGPSEKVVLVFLVFPLLLTIWIFFSLPSATASCNPSEKRIKHWLCFLPSSLGSCVPKSACYTPVGPVWACQSLIPVRGTGCSLTALLSLCSLLQVAKKRNPAAPWAFLHDWNPWEDEEGLQSHEGEKGLLWTEDHFDRDMGCIGPDLHRHLGRFIFPLHKRDLCLFPHTVKAPVRAFFGMLL